MQRNSVYTNKNYTNYKIIVFKIDMILDNLKCNRLPHIIETYDRLVKKSGFHYYYVQKMMDMIGTVKNYKDKVNLYNNCQKARYYLINSIRKKCLTEREVELINNLDKCSYSLPIKILISDIVEEGALYNMDNIIKLYKLLQYIDNPIYNELLDIIFQIDPILKEIRFYEIKTKE